MMVSAVGFFGNVSLSRARGTVVVVVAVLIEFVLIMLVVVLVSSGLACFIVECDFALLVVFGLSSDAAGRWQKKLTRNNLLVNYFTFNPLLGTLMPNSCKFL